MEKKKKSGAINNGAGWDNSSRNMLKELISKGLPVKKIAKVMGRTPNAITYQKSMMGLTTPNPVRVSKGKPKNFINLLDLIKKAKESNMTKVPKMPAAIKSKIVAKRVTAPIVAPPEAPVVNPSNVTREHAKDITRSAREIARANGKRITMAMFFVEDL